MQPFERAAIEFIIGNSLIAGDVRAQLESVSVVDRTRDRYALTTHFVVAADAYGEVTAYISIEEGHLTELVFEVYGPHWPERPRILGLVPSAQ
jgi:hypothetical protein